MSVYHEVSALTVSDRFTLLGRYTEHPGMVGETCISYQLFFLDHCAMQIMACSYDEAMDYYRAARGKTHRLALWRLISPASPKAEADRDRALNADIHSRIS